MYYINILEDCLIVLLLIIFLRNKFIGLQKKKKPKVQRSEAQTDKTLPDLYGANRRKSFRIELLEVQCEMEFLDFENPQLTKLKQKKITGVIENISIGGLKFVTPYSFPVNKAIYVLLQFKLRDQDFCIKGEVVRKEEYTHRNLQAYGIHFPEISSTDETLLLRCIHQILLERKQIG